MTVAQVITTLDIGGATYVATSLARALARDHAVVVFAGSSPENWMTRPLREAGVAVRTVPGLRNRLDPLAYARAVRWLRGSLRGYDVVHTHSTVAGVLGRTAARLARVRCVVHTVHGWGVLPTQHGAVRAAVVASERVAARWTDRLITPSAAVRDAGLRMRVGRPEQYAVIPVGIPVARFAGSRAERGRVVVGFAGRLDAQKSPETFVWLAAEVRARHPEVAFAVAGDGPDRARCEALAASLGVPVEWRGEASDPAGFYRSCDVLVLPSRWEGTPLVLIEAMASGCAVAAFAVGGVADVVGEDGLLVPSGDLPALVTAVLRLVEDPDLRRRLADGARSRAARFDEAATHDRVAALYREVLEAKA